MTTIQLPRPDRPYVVATAARECAELGLPAAEIEPLFKAYGAILLRGFRVDVDAFAKFARRFCPTSVINESPGRVTIDHAHNIRTVDIGTNAFNLHAELAREPWKPDAAFFACLSAPSAGGATTICDGVELVRHLPAAVRNGLNDRRLLHIQRTWPAMLEFWLGSATPSDAMLAVPPDDCPYEFRRKGDQIIRMFTRPALHTPMFVDERAFGNFLLFARFNNNRRDFPVLDDGTPVPEDWLQSIKATGDALSVAVNWRQGDILMLDNSRFMHGRTAIINSAERLIASFFGYLSFAPENLEEPVNPRWRRADFRPPLPPSIAEIG